jgi:hypothetical protein
LRQIKGTLGSIAHLLGIGIKIPDHTTYVDGPASGNRDLLRLSASHRAAYEPVSPPKPIGSSTAWSSSP